MIWANNGDIKNKLYPLGLAVPVMVGGTLAGIFHNIYAGYFALPSDSEPKYNREYESIHSLDKDGSVVEDN